MKSLLTILLTLFSINSLRAQIDSLAEIRRQINILTEEIEQMKLGAADEEQSYTPSRGLGAAA